MTHLWRWYGMSGAAIVLGCAAAFIVGSMPEPTYVRAGHVVVHGVDYGAPGEKAFENVVAAEGLVGSDELAALGPKAYQEVRDVAQLYCSLRAKHAGIDPDDLVVVATEDFNERYARAKSPTETVLRDAAAAEAAKYWCPPGYVDASIAPPPKRME
ncbi:MAG TPA: hypothetical protein VMU22_15565 [Rhizomicrobium sp.]|nr:hypothetical protein [Rhizomicrobium sp.]